MLIFWNQGVKDQCYCLWAVKSPCQVYLLLFFITKHPIRSNFSEKGSVWAHGLGIVHHGREDAIVVGIRRGSQLWQQEYKVAVPAKKQRKMNIQGLSWLPFFSLISTFSNTAHKVVLSTFRMGLLSLVFSENTLTTMPSGVVSPRRFFITWQWRLATTRWLERSFHRSLTHQNHGRIMIERKKWAEYWSHRKTGVWTRDVLMADGRREVGLREDISSKLILKGSSSDDSKQGALIPSALACGTRDRGGKGMGSREW